MFTLASLFINTPNIERILKMEHRIRLAVTALWIDAILFALILLCALLICGCESGVVEGIGIGLGTSQAATEAEKLAAQKKSILVAEILKLRNDLEVASPEEKAALEAKLAGLERKQEIAEMTSSITDQIKAGIERDWGDKPASPDNLAWILGSAATVLGGIAGKKTLDDRKHLAAINRVKVASKNSDGLKTGEVYKAINGA